MRCARALLRNSRQTGFFFSYSFDRSFVRSFISMQTIKFKVIVHWYRMLFVDEPFAHWLAILRTRTTWVCFKISFKSPILSCSFFWFVECIHANLLHRMKCEEKKKPSTARHSNFKFVYCIECNWIARCCGLFSRSLVCPYVLLYLVGMTCNWI